ncbi:MAG: hypothetical protein RIC16_10530 [Rhodospirillales bacterium]
MDLPNTRRVSIDDLKPEVSRNAAFVDFWRDTMVFPDRVALRSDFVAERIPSLWSNLLLHDLSSGDDDVLRLVGTAVVERFGRDPTGTSYLDFVRPERREPALKSLLGSVHQPCGMLGLIDWVYASGKRERIESVGFPMWRTADGDGFFLLFCNHVLDAPVFDFSYRDPEHRFSYAEIVARTWIDVGFGTVGA